MPKVRQVSVLDYDFREMQTLTLPEETTEEAVELIRDTVRKRYLEIRDDPTGDAPFNSIEEENAYQGGSDVGFFLWYVQEHYGWKCEESLTMTLRIDF